MRIASTRLQLISLDFISFCVFESVLEMNTDATKSKLQWVFNPNSIASL